MNGSLVAGQSGGVTAVLNSSLAGVIHAASASGQVDRIFGMRHGIRGLLENELLALDGLDDVFLDRLSRTPGAWLGSCRFAPTSDELALLLERLRAIDARYYIYAGGNDSADTSARLSALALAQGYDLHVVNVPKTIDNDLPDMDHCPGYASAAAYVAMSTRLLCLDTQAMRREEPVRVIEVKGRHSGWLAAAAAAFEGPDGGRPLCIYVPEQPLENRKVLDDVACGLSRSGYAVLVVSEHAVDATGRQVGESENVYVDPFGHDDSHGPGAFIQSLVQTDLKQRCRLDVLGAMQKVSLLPTCDLDRREAFAAGEHAVQTALSGETGRCVTLNRERGDEYRVTYGLTDLERIARTERLLPEGFVEGSSPTAAFRAWLRPLLAGLEPQIEQLVEMSS